MVGERAGQSSIYIRPPKDTKCDMHGQEDGQPRSHL